MTAGDALAAMRALPRAGLAEILGGAAPLVLAPHPDDESLGCGGLLAASAAAGLRPAVLFLTDGTGSHPRSRRFPADRLRAVREAEAREAAATLGVAADRVGFMGLRDTAAPDSGPAMEAAAEIIAAQAAAWGSGVLLAPWRHDPHGDHLAAHRIATAAAARGGVRHLAYPVWGLTLPPERVLDGPAIAGWRLDVSDHRERKRAAVLAHRSQWAGLIDDDPSGFQMTPAFMALFAGDDECFLSTP